MSQTPTPQPTTISAGHVLLLGVIFLLALALILTPLRVISVNAQRVQPPGGPDDATSRMYTLQDVYDRVDTGATPSLATDFTQPTSGPTTVSGLPSINDIMGILPEVDDTDCADPANVLQGKTYFGLCGGSWGTRTGTASADPELAATGQDTCYDASGNVISCTGTGQDGEYQLGAVASPRFTDNSDGTVTDNLTNLVWLQNANCFGTRVWETALTDANNLASGSCGLTDGSVAGDWRLPNVRELASLVDYQTATAPRIPTGHPFTSVQSSFYWSSTSYRPVLSAAWTVVFSNGNVNNNLKSSSLYVWPVR